MLTAPIISSQKDSHGTRKATSRALSQEICKAISVCANNSLTFAAAWTLSSETMAAATLDAASQTGTFSMHQVSCIRVRWHRAERTLAAYINHRHAGPSPGMMVCGAIGYMSRSPLVRIDGTLNSARYISGVLRPVTVPIIQILRNRTFKQDNARPHVAGIVRAFLDTVNVRLLPWPCKFIRSFTNKKRLVYAPVTTVDELC
ncbi:transposable element Tcb1 transposase [Trichonephila clavipes]|uniref:Transposable element Tcb1 transposase n=1 Tax=Trichonephila clavipes TaxID=2585209 RepID=A0A8X6WG41_TRICX|nr:transposable element Tcb1 transposase [Trichonephila clavipes]